MSAPSVEGAMTAPSAVAFARRGGVRLAFRTAGREDAPAAVLVPGFASHVEVLWDDAGPRVFHERLAARLRLVVYDRRGQGRSSAAAPPTVDDDAADLGAILDAAGPRASGRRRAVAGRRHGDHLRGHRARAGRRARPGRLLRPRRVRRRVPARAATRAAARVRRRGRGRVGRCRAGRRVRPERRRRPRFRRMVDPRVPDGPDADAVRATLERRAHLDVRAHLAAVRVPAMVVHRTGDGITPVEHGRWLADHIPAPGCASCPAPTTSGGCPSRSRSPT